MKFTSEIALSPEDVKLGAPVSACFNEVVNGALPGRQSDIAKMYLSINGDDIRAEARGRNLFLPTSVGGLGQTAPVGLKTRISDQQVALAHIIWAKEPYKVPHVRPFPQGRELDEVQDLILEPLGLSVTPEGEDEAQWLTRKESATLQSKRLLLFGLTPYLQA